MSETEKAAETAAAQHKLGAAELALALRSAGIGLLLQGVDLHYSAAENLPPALAAKWRLGCSEEELFPPALAAQMRAAKQRILSGGAAEKLEARLHITAEKAEQPPIENLSEAEALQAEAKAARAAMAAEQQQSRSLPFFGYYMPAQTAKAGAAGKDAAAPFIWLRFCFTPQHDESGRIIGIITAAENITELRGREEMLDVLLREVSHRSKNLLAIIQSIAAQTARFTADTADFIKKFQGRLQSLSSSQDLVTESDWRGARLHDLIRAQMRFYINGCSGGGGAGAGAEGSGAGAEGGLKLEIKGENPYLSPSAALHLGLALHELAVNSASYGALALGAGTISLDCAPAELMADEGSEGPRPGLRLRWRESFPPAAAEGSMAAAAPDNLPSIPAAAGPAGDRHCPAGNDNAPPARPRFGSIVLERIVPSALNGRAEYTIINSNIEYILVFPLENYSDR